METRAHHLLIGSFVLAAILGLFIFTIWIAKFSPDTSYTEYDMVFHESISGLTRDGEVQFNGIPVGKVKKITVEGDNVSAVRVTASILSSTPIQVGSVATLEVKGITGVIYIQIRGAKKPGPRIEAPRLFRNPEIPTEPSILFSLYEGFPGMIKEGAVTLQRINQLLGPDNQTHFAGILKNLDTTTAALAARSKDLDKAILNMESAFARVDAAATALERFGNTADAAITDLRPALKEAEGLMKEAKGTAAELHALVAENRPAIGSFANQTLPEIGRLTIELEKMSQSLTRLSDKLDQDAGEALFGTPRPKRKE